MIVRIQRSNYTEAALVLFPLFILQAISFYFFFAYDIRPFPPDIADQAEYLSRAYRIVTDYDLHGFTAIANATLGNSPQGALFPIEAAISEILTRSGRLSALLVNFIAFVALEAVLFVTVKKVTNSFALAVGGLSLLLATHTMWFWAGGIFDYRIDWLASCFFGIWCCLTLRSHIYANPGYTYMAALVAIVLILNRFIAATYVFGIELVLFLLAIIAGRLEETSQRTVNIGKSIVLKVILLSPFIIMSRDAIYAYYVVGHLTGSEKYIRAQEAGVSDLWSNVSFYPRSILSNHLGSGFFIVLAILAGSTLASWLNQTTLRAGTENASSGDKYLEIWQGLFLIGAISAPIAILTIDLAKSPVVGSIVDVPIILLLIMIPGWLGIVNTETANSRSPWLLIGGLASLAAGIVVSITYNLRSARTAYRSDLTAWACNVKHVIRDAEESQTKKPIIFFDRLAPHTMAVAYTAASYEYQGQLIDFHSALPGQLAALSPQETIAALKASDYAVISDAPMLGIYPTNLAMKAMATQLNAWTNEHMTLMATYNYDGGAVQLFKRGTGVTAAPQPDCTIENKFALVYR